MNILANRMDLGFKAHQQEYENAALKVLRSGWYVLGDEVTRFEHDFSEFHSPDSYCAGVASGLDALWIGMRCLGIGKGDEVIVQANTYIASVMGITINGATPVFVEPDEDSQIDVNAIESAITPKTKAVMVVHLYGQVTDMEAICDICSKHNLYLVEDCAQAHGAQWNGRKVGTFGDVSCFSFYPTKNIGAFGDAGAVVSKNKDLIEEVKVFRNYGSQVHYYNKVVGANSRLDEIQAALLNVRLKYFEEITDERRRLASRYSAEINNPAILKPVERAGSYAVWHQYVIRSSSRSELIDYLNECGVKTAIHYPLPPHLQEAYAYLGHHENDFPLAEQLANEVLSIPMYNGMTFEEQSYVIETINRFKR